MEWSITIPQHSQVKTAIAAIEETAWKPIDYPKGGVAQVAETAITASRKGNRRRVRVVVRRTRLTDPAQAQLWPDWRYHAFATNTGLSAVAADAFYRAHARVELAIRDIKQHAGLSHCPSGNFFANAAWLACATLAHNLYRWIEQHTRPAGRLTNGNTVRTRLFRLPGRIVNPGWLFFRDLWASSNACVLVSKTPLYQVDDNLSMTGE